MFIPLGAKNGLFSGLGAHRLGGEGSGLWRPPPSRHSLL